MNKQIIFEKKFAILFEQTTYLKTTKNVDANQLSHPVNRSFNLSELRKDLGDEMFSVVVVPVEISRFHL